ncbi:MAG: ATP-dependent sacrificial sulfur transferase LarE [Gemmatimonadota bacterium]|nr:MAG: ATP-dependent sacrificial sulfur transferase LarE [Gemmatimonadota bacterium]
MDLSTDNLEAKERALHDLLRHCGRAVIGYSGGVDSTYLAKAALDALGEDHVLAVTALSPSFPQSQREAAERVACSIGLPHLKIETNETSDPNYLANPRDRCYFCKTELYGQLVAVARERGFASVLDGSNADDLDDHRPGLRAVRELGVRSPLQEVGLTKSEIRELSRRAGLSTWEMPASPCLASRLPYGTPVTPQRLRQVEEAESRLRTLHGWGDLRVRHHGDLARLEVAGADLALFERPGLRVWVAQALQQAGYSRAGLDLQGYRRGALNERAGSVLTGNGPSTSEAERRLAPYGIRAGVEGAGADGEVAVIRVASGAGRLVGELRAAAVEACRAAGFRYVTLALL